MTEERSAFCYEGRDEQKEDRECVCFSLTCVNAWCPWMFGFAHILKPDIL